MTQAFDADRELLEAALRRHDHWLPLTAATCLSAAIDALTDPVVLPSLAPAGLIDTEDVRVVINDVRARLGAAARRSWAAAAVAVAAQAETADPGAAPQTPYCASLEEWVVEVFAPTFNRRPTPTFRWCGEWWRHAEAISRLEALWRSWEALRLEPLLGMATWYRDHLDPQLPVLTSAAGPFADCDPNRHFPAELDELAHVPAPPDWWSRDEE